MFCLFTAYRYGVDAVLLRVHTAGLLGPGAVAVRPVAVGRLHRVPGVAVHGAADHGRPVLFREDRRPVPGLADQGQGHVDGGAHVDHPGAVVLHQHIRLGTLCRLPGPVAGPVRRAVPQGSISIQ